LKILFVSYRRISIRHFYINKKIHRCQQSKRRIFIILHTIYQAKISAPEKCKNLVKYARKDTIFLLIL